MGKEKRIIKIRIDFSAGTGVGAAGIIERVGIGGGTLLKSGSSITYDVTSPVSIPAGTFIRLEIFGIKNPTYPFNELFSPLSATITTRDSPWPDTWSGILPMAGNTHQKNVTNRKEEIIDLTDTVRCNKFV